ncbi:NUDIX domain-containing protein [soil metagenome]
MKASYCIYFDEKPFLIIPVADEETRLLEAIPTTTVISGLDESAISDAINRLDQMPFGAVIVYTEHTERAFNILKNYFTLIQAGGGLVVNEKEEYLFIFRRGKWDLPKGKLDEGESIAECGLREVEEETGLQEITLLDHLCNTYHVYHERGKFILKESVWYNMACQSGQLLTPQAEEDIHEISWLTPAGWHSIFDNTFPSIKDVLKASGKLATNTLAAN